MVVNTNIFFRFVFCGLLCFAPSFVRSEYLFSTIAGTAGIEGWMDGTNSAARFRFPTGLALHASGTLYLSDFGSGRIRRISREGPDWVVTSIAGQTYVGGSADGTNNDALFGGSIGIAVDVSTNIFLADTGNHTVRKITPVGTNWVVTTVAGLAGNIGGLDGTNSSARFNYPYGIAVTDAGILYVADTHNFTIRKITPVGTNWVVSTVAGLVGVSGNTDGTNSNALFSSPYGIAVDKNMNLFVADWNNPVIRKISPVGANWVVSTLAGSPRFGGNSDGTNDQARFYNPSGIALDRAGTLYVTDTGNNTIRMLTPAGTDWVVTTIGGLALSKGSADGIGNIARFQAPIGIAVDGEANVYVADHRNETIRMGQYMPALEMRLIPDHVIISWPSSATNYVLETSANLLWGDSWMSLSNGVAIIGDRCVLTNETGSVAAFYRLHKR